MGKVKDEIQNLRDTCQRLYQIGGATAVIDYIEEAMRQGDDMAILSVVYERCEACDASMPSLNHTCLVCGQPTAPHVGKFCPEPIYFKVIKSGWNGDTQRQEVEINCGENGKLFLIKTDEGFIVDVYNQDDDNVNTMTVWEEDLNPEDEDESNLPVTFTDEEIEQWKKDWGQTHSGITAELGYPKSHAKSDGLLMEDYFWIEKDKRWYNRNASMFTDREEAIADYLYAQSTYQNL